MFFIKSFFRQFLKIENLSRSMCIKFYNWVSITIITIQLNIKTLLLPLGLYPPRSITNFKEYNITWDFKLSNKFPTINLINKKSKTNDFIYGFNEPNLQTFKLLSVLKTYYFMIVREFTEIYIRSFSFGFYYLQGCVFILFIDAWITDDEPLWEPIEWSLVQTWILIIFMFGWIGENLIVSRYGSYTGRDKRVWMAWYKTFWLVEVYYLINFAAVAMFIIIPFYFELNYSLSFVYTWWHWYSRVFFFKFISLFSIVLYTSYLLQMSVRWLNWRKGLVLIILINIFLSYLIYTHFIMSFFGYFTDPIWYQKTRTNDYVQLSHEPSRWGWGPAKKDHFTYHNVKTVFWFKNDGPFASAFLLLHLYVFLSLFFIYIYWITLFRRVYSMKEIPLTYTTYCVSTLKQFFYSFLMIYGFIFVSFITQYWRLPIEFFWGINVTSWWGNFIVIMSDYIWFILTLFN